MEWFRNDYSKWVKIGCPVDTTVVKLNVSSLNYDDVPHFFFNLKNLPNLKKLICSDNYITSLEGVEQLITLEYFDCSHNEITSLDNILYLTNIVYFNCSYNQLTLTTSDVFNIKNKLTHLKHFVYHNNLHINANIDANIDANNDDCTIILSIPYHRARKLEIYPEKPQYDGDDFQEILIMKDNYPTYTLEELYEIKTMKIFKLGHKHNFEDHDYYKIIKLLNKYPNKTYEQIENMYLLHKKTNEFCIIN
jgi:hypothetical protein